MPIMNKEVQMKVIEASVSNLDDIAILFDAYRQFYEQESDIQGAMHISEHSDQSFRYYPITHFGLNRSLIP
ncbi:GGDEF family domain protein, partial [Vibrio cholerae O1 str. 116063]